MMRGVTYLFITFTSGAVTYVFITFMRGDVIYIIYYHLVITSMAGFVREAINILGFLKPIRPYGFRLMGLTDLITSWISILSHDSLPYEHEPQKIMNCKNETRQGPPLRSLPYLHCLICIAQ